MPFRPGVSGNPGGKPKGALNRRWANVGYWFGIIEANLPSLTPAQRVRCAQWAMTLLIAKMKSVDTVETSKANAEQGAEMLKLLEAAAPAPNPEGYSASTEKAPIDRAKTDSKPDWYTDIGRKPQGG